MSNSQLYIMRATRQLINLEVYNVGGRLALKVKPGYSGDVVVRFTGFVFWKISAVVSMLAFVVLIICITGKEKVILKVLANKKN